MQAGIPKDLTVELAMKLVTIKEIAVRVSSELVLSEDGQTIKPKVKIATITKESDLTPEIILSGPKLRGEINCYVLCDGLKAYFNAKTGEAIGREFAAKIPVGPRGRSNTVVRASRTSQEVDRRYIR